MACRYFALLVFITFLGLGVSASHASSNLSQDISEDSLRTLKRLEYKEGLPNGLLHAISLVDTNIGQTQKYMPWPYTIRLKGYTAKEVNSVDEAYEILMHLSALGYQNYDLVLDGESAYSLSSYNVQEYLSEKEIVKSIVISARGLIKYLQTKQEAEAFLANLVDNNWSLFKVGIMQLDYALVEKNLTDVNDSLNPYYNINIMLKELKEIRRQYGWWESVGKYHSDNPLLAKRYVKNVWSMYQRVHKLKVK